MKRQFGYAIVKNMKQQIANYTIVIEKEKIIGTQKFCYTAFVPLLGIATEADTVEKAQTAIQQLIQFHIESLALEGLDIPVQTKDAFVTKSEVILHAGANIAYS